MALSLLSSLRRGEDQRLGGEDLLKRTTKDSPSLVPPIFSLKDSCRDALQEDTIQGIGSSIKNKKKAKS
jgi:hypothetical protein